MEHDSDSSFETILRTMSHDVRTPLTSIMGFSELVLEDENLTGQSREYVRIISDESQKLSAMLNHYLSLLLVKIDGEIPEEVNGENEVA